MLMKNLVLAFKPWLIVLVPNNGFILKDDELGALVSIQPWLILIDGRESTIFQATVLCTRARSYEKSGKALLDIPA